MWQIKEPWHWLHRYLYTHTPRSTNWERDRDIQLTVNKAPWRKAAIWSADTKRAWPCTLQNTCCWNGRTHWWNTRHRVLEHSDPQISRQDWEKGDFAERTWSALMASVRGCWQRLFLDQENDRLGECRPRVPGSKDRGQEWAARGLSG